jgi:hypothetical protein
LVAVLLNVREVTADKNFGMAGWIQVLIYLHTAATVKAVRHAGSISEQFAERRSLYAGCP